MPQINHHQVAPRIACSEARFPARAAQDAKRADRLGLGQSWRSDCAGAGLLSG